MAPVLIHRPTVHQLSLDPLVYTHPCSTVVAGFATFYVAAWQQEHHLEQNGGGMRSLGLLGLSLGLGGVSLSPWPITVGRLQQWLLLLLLLLLLFLLLLLLLLLLELLILLLLFVPELAIPMQAPGIEQCDADWIECYA